MKATFGIVLLTSVVFGIFSVVYGIEASGQRPGYRRSRLERQSEYEQFERRRSSLHNVVRGVSIPFYLLCLSAFAVSFFRSKGHQLWRVFSAIAIAIAAVMVGWSCILSGGVSFDEVFAVWIVASVLFVGLSVAALLRKPWKVSV